MYLGFKIIWFRTWGTELSDQYAAQLVVHGFRSKRLARIQFTGKLKHEWELSDGAERTTLTTVTTVRNQCTPRTPRTPAWGSNQRVMRRLWHNAGLTSATLGDHRQLERRYMAHSESTVHPSVYEYLLFLARLDRRRLPYNSGWTCN